MPKVGAGILILLSLWGCRPETRAPDLEGTYEAAGAAVRRGDFAVAASLIQAGLAAARQQEKSDWTWKFLLVSSERLILNRQPMAALQALDGEVPETLEPTSLRARISLNRARACMQLERYAEAERHLSEAERLAGTDDPSLPVEILNRKGQLMVGQKQVGQARGLFQEAYRLALESGVPRLRIEAAGNLGWFFEGPASRPDQAIPYYEQALREAMEAGDRLSIVRAKTNLGWCHNKLGDLERALELIESAVPLAIEAGSPDLANTLAGIGGVYQNWGDYTKAIDYFKRAVEAATDAKTRAQYLNNLATCHIEKGDWDAAESFNERALSDRSAEDPEGLAYSRIASAEILIGRGRLEEAEKTLLGVVEEATAFLNPTPLWLAYSNLGRLSVERGDAGHADRWYQLALGTIESVRQELTREEWQISFHSLWNHFAAAYFDLLVAQERSDRALENVEANRALVLTEKLGVSGDDGPSSVDDFRETARRLNATLLSYWLAPKRSFLWAVTEHEIRLAQLPPVEEIEKLVESHQNRLLASQSDDRQDPYAVRLYEVLIKPVADLLKPGSRVVLVPDGRLHELNFETLQTPGEGSRYLIEDFTLALAPSLPLLRPWRDSTPPKSLLLIGDPVAFDPSFPKLTGAETEIEAIRRNFDPDEIEAILGKDATPQAYPEASPGDYALLHFTAHAVANTVEPLNSAVILSPREGAYRLFARDVEESRLRASVVTLSACRGAGAKAYSGEGLVGFAWAFLQAGAQNVVAGLWDVDDGATAQLMGVFYQALSEGKSPAQALREAKRDLLSKGGAYSKPVYWAPFAIYTRSSPFGAPPATLAFRR